MVSPLRPAANGVSSGYSILAIDYGRVRLGLALSDGLALTAQPLVVLKRTNRRVDLARLREICRLHSVKRLVVGWPLRLDGTSGDMAAEAARFAERLRKNLGLPVDLVDERLSSWEADELIRETSGLRKRSGKLKKPADDVAAAIILRDYLSRRRRTG